MESNPLKRRVTVLTAVVLLGASLLGSLVLMSAAIQNSGRFGALYSFMLISNGVGLLAFVALIAINFRRLARQLRDREPGSLLTRRMLIIFVTLAIVPVIVLYGFSLDFLRRGIDSWFDVRIDAAMTDSLELSRAALDLRMRELLGETKLIAEEIGAGGQSSTPLNLDALRSPGSTIVANVWTPRNDLELLRERSGADELTVVSSDGRLLRSSTRSTVIVPTLPSEAMLLQLRQGQSYIGLDPIRDSGLYIRVAVNVPDGSIGGGRRALHALYPVASRMNRLAASVEDAYARYTKLAYLRDQLKLSFVMTLTLVLLFSILTAVWAAFYSAQKLAQPIRDLAAGTAAVAKGDYETTLPVQSDDDMGFLVRSFNDMTRRVALARTEVEAQHNYLDTVLSQLSSGVIAVDEQRLVKTINDSAKQILELGTGSYIGQRFDKLLDDREYLRPFVEEILPELESGCDRWQHQVAIFRPSGRRVLMCRGTRLSPAPNDASGYVLVFDDITALMQGQRDAAWSEVARRLAHEIKNPLTPIQLSAEQLRRKYLAKLQIEDGDALDRLTNTIIQQVDTMKSMVNTFSDYARPPRINPERTDLNELVSGVVDLFKTSAPNASFELDLEADLPTIPADSNRLRQVINNLVKNAIEASSQNENPRIFVYTRKQISDFGTHIEIRIEDRGEGLRDNMLDTIFEPYATSKGKGTGLGLAIVKKIVEEHGGEVSLVNNDGPGAAAVVRLPLEGRSEPGSISVTRNVV